MSVTVNIHGAENLGEVFDIMLEEAQAARAQGVPVEVAQERGVMESAIIITIGSLIEPFVKEFLTKFLGRVAQNIADRLSSPKPKPVEPFTVTVNGTSYTLPDDLERMRSEQDLQ